MNQPVSAMRGTFVQVSHLPAVLIAFLVMTLAYCMSVQNLDYAMAFSWGLLWRPQKLPVCKLVKELMVAIGILMMHRYSFVPWPHHAILLSSVAMMIANMDKLNVS